MIVKTSPAVINMSETKALNKSTQTQPEENKFPDLLENVSSIKSVSSTGETKKLSHAASKPDKNQLGNDLVILSELGPFELPDVNPDLALKKDTVVFITPQAQVLQQMIVDNVQATSPIPMVAPVIMSVQPDTSFILESGIAYENQGNTDALVPTVNGDNLLAKELSPGQINLSQDDLTSRYSIPTMQSLISGKQGVETVDGEQHETFLSVAKKTDDSLNTMGEKIGALKSTWVTQQHDTQGPPHLLTSTIGVLPHVTSTIHVSEAPSAITPNTYALTNHAFGTSAWQQGLSHQLSFFAKNGIQNAELRLHPEDLGMLKINLRLKNDQAQVHFVTENHQVSSVLEAAMPHLRNSLAESGINLGLSSVGADTSSSWNQFSQFKGSHSNPFLDNNAQEEGHAVEESEPLVTRTIHYSSGINTFV